MKTKPDRTDDLELKWHDDPKVWFFIFVMCLIGLLNPRIPIAWGALISAIFGVGTYFQQLEARKK